MPQHEPEHEEALRLVIESLCSAFPDRDAAEVASIAREEFDAVWSHSKAPAFVGILAEKQARARLLG